LARWWWCRIELSFSGFCRRSPASVRLAQKDAALNIPGPVGGFCKKAKPGNSLKEAQCIMLQWIWKLAVALAAIVAAVAWLDRSNTQEYIEIYSDDDEEEDAF